MLHNERGTAVRLSTGALLPAAFLLLIFLLKKWVSFIIGLFYRVLVKRTKQQLFSPCLCSISDSQVPWLSAFFPRCQLEFDYISFCLLLGVHWLNSVLHPTSCTDILMNSHVYINLPINSRLCTNLNEEAQGEFLCVKIHLFSPLCLSLMC